MFADGDFSLLPYLPFALVPFYPLFQARSFERMERNYSDWEVCEHRFEQGKPFTFLVSSITKLRNQMRKFMSPLHDVSEVPVSVMEEPTGTLSRVPHCSLNLRHSSTG